MKLYLAGAETPHVCETLCKAEAPYVMLSYYYLKKRSKKAVRELLTDLKEAGAQVALQSGYVSLVNSTSGKDAEKIRKYAKSYNSLIFEFEDLIHTVFSFDKSPSLDVTEVVDLFNELKEDFDGEVFLSAPSLSKEDVEWACSLSEFVALPSGFNKQEYSRAMTMKHRKAGVKFHGFGVSTPEVISSVPFYSCDTGTWLTGGRYGALFKYKGGLKIDRVVDTRTPDSKKQSFFRTNRVLINKLGLNYEDLAAGKGSELNMWNALQWIDFCKDCVKRKRGKEYWHKTTRASNEETELTTKSNQQLQKQEAPSALSFGLDPRLSVKRQCNTCIIADSCPVFLKDSECRITNTKTIKSVEDLDDAAQALLTAQTDRVMHAMMVERLEGGMLTEEVSLELERVLSSIAKHRKGVTSSKNSITVTGQGEGAGLLASLLSNVGSGTDNTGSQPRAARQARKQREKQAVEESKLESDILEAEIIDME